ncbi:prolyl oligopeptidase family serine peptidase [uncultured Aquimarina sp.]|uniref:prolyl oligopeptidase family serine peptidase n=1 Tax=uncultured Aquimarina sp. TaxID=575652 RepID=UPI00260B8D7A|nr:prolyl oligopeptidase family serine peptidase [uncultured Aquimarina sp.]
MINYRFIIRFIFLIIFLVSCDSNSQEKSDTTVDFYHGIKIIDEYKYLENIEDTSVISWLKKQTEEAEITLNRIAGREKLIELQKQLGNNKTNSASNLRVIENGGLFYLRSSTKDNSSKLYYRSNLHADEELLFDPKDFFPESKLNYRINYFNPSWDGKKVVISFVKNGEEFSEMRFFDFSTKKLLPTKMNKCLPTYGGVYWLPDNTGVTYLRTIIRDTKSKEAYFNLEVVKHKIGSTPTKLFSRNNDPKLEMKPEDIPVVLIENPNDKYVISAVAGATPYHDFYYLSSDQIEQNNKSWIPLFKKHNKVTSFYQDNDSIIYLTSENASNFKICKASLLNPDNKKPIVVIEEKQKEVIKSFRLVKSGVVYTTTKNGVESKLFLLNNNGKDEEIKLPFPAGRISLESGGKNQDYITLKIRGWLHPESRFTYNFSDKSFTKANLFEPTENSYVNDMEVEEIEVISHDGELVPLSLVYKKNLVKNNKNSVLMIGYGAYGSSLQPMNSVKIMTWVQEGGIFAIAHVRGGGEKGDAWYKGGYKDTKPNSWKDFIACGEYLIHKKYTSKKKIAVNGGSAGGITVGRALTERPDLFASVIINVGKMNTIRGEIGLNGKNNAKEFGSVKDSVGFRGLLEMDSYHHVKKGVSYPAMLVTTGINDARVSPWHSIKFAKKIQDFNSSIKPILLKVGFKSGHGIGNSAQKRIEDTADVLSFAFWQTGHPNYQPKK